MQKKIKIIFLSLFFCFTLCLFSKSTQVPNKPFVRLPLRGNALDLHFINLTETTLNAVPHCYSASEKIPAPSKRNLLFIPNQSLKGNKDFPFEVKLAPIQNLESSKDSRLLARKFIQGIVIYNNPATYSDYVYNSKANFTSYSSYMWTNGTRPQKNGKYSYKNAINELNNLYYDIKIPLKNGKEFLSFKLKFHAISNLDVKSKIFRSAPGYVQDFNNLAAILNIVSGILSIPSNPAAGITSMLAGVAWTISGTGWMMNTDFNYTQLKLFNSGLSWLSSPFDIIVYPDDYKVIDDKGKVIAIPELDRERCAFSYFLGTNSNPQSVIVQITGSAKGDLYVYALSKNLIIKSNINSLLSKNKKYLKEPYKNVIEQKK